MYIRTSRLRFIHLGPSKPVDLPFIFADFPHLQITIYAYCLCDIRHMIQLHLIHGHVLYGAPAFIQHKHSQLNYRTPSPKAHNRPTSASSCLLPRTTRHLQRSRGFARCPNALLLLVLFCPVLFSGCWFLLEIIKQRY